MGGFEIPHAKCSAPVERGWLSMHRGKVSMQPLVVMHLLQVRTCLATHNLWTALLSSSSSDQAQVQTQNSKAQTQKIISD